MNQQRLHGTSHSYGRTHIQGQLTSLTSRDIGSVHNIHSRACRIKSNYISSDKGRKELGNDTKIGGFSVRLSNPIGRIGREVSQDSNSELPSFTVRCTTLWRTHQSSQLCLNRGLGACCVFSGLFFWTRSSDNVSAAVGSEKLPACQHHLLFTIAKWHKMSSSTPVTVQLPPKAVLSSYHANNNFLSYDSLIAVGYSIVLNRFLDVNAYVYLRTPRLSEELDITATGAGKRRVVQYNADSTIVEALKNIELGTPCNTHPDGDAMIHGAFLSQGDDDQNPNNSQRAFALVLAPFGMNDKVAVLEVNTTMFSKFQARSMGCTFSQALRALTDSREGALSQRLAALDLLSPEDLAIINSWNQTRLVSSQECVPDLVERICKKYPHELAVISSHDGFSLTYERLNKLANRLACFLVTKYNLGRGAVIPLCFDKSPLAVVAMLAVLKTRAAYCCLDPQHPRARHDFILQSVKASLVLVSPEHQGLFSAPVLIVDSKLMHELDDYNDENGPNFDQMRPDDTCIVAFSSGSTGVPKGIMHMHETLTTGLIQNGPGHGLDRLGIRVFQWCAYTFDISLTEIWGTLICGGVVCIPSEHERLNDVEAAMNRMAVEWAFFTPSFARFFCRQRYRVETLKTLAVGGEALTQQDAHTFLEDLDLDRVVQVFGPAEFITMFLKTITSKDQYPEREREQSENVPFVPSNAHSWVVDPDNLDRLAPVGAVGELLIEGPALFTEYLNDAQRTAAALVKAPQWRSSMDIGPPVFRIYRSGDLVRYLENGEMRYVSRKDGVVKLRGQFVDLGEIESLLRTALGSALECLNIPGEMEAETAVLLATHENVSFIPAGDQALVTLIRPNQKERTTCRQDILHTAAKALQSQLRKSVPEYMVPRLFYPIDAFPYNASGKLDRKRLTLSLPSLDPEKWLRLSGSDSTDVSTSANGNPQNFHSPLAQKHDGETYHAIAGLLMKAWIDVLGQPDLEFSIHDDFFQRGGNSMRAMELVAAARRYGISVTVGKIFGNPVFDHLVSAASMARNSDRNGKQEDDARSSAETIPFSLLGPERTKDEILMQSIAQCYGLSELDVQDILPATPIQSEFMASGIRRPGTFVAQTWLAVPSHITIDHLQKVWKQLNDSFPTLRCRMVHIGATTNTISHQDLLVLINPQRPLDWVKVAHGTQLDNYLAQDRATPMGYGDSLVRYAILDSGTNAEQENSNIMVLTMHQCIYDGFTVKRLHQAMNELLNCQDDSTALVTTPSFTPFIEQITMQSNKQTTESFWQDYFVGYWDTDGAPRKQQSPFPALPDSSCVIEADSLFATNIQTPALGPNLKHITLPTIVLAGWAMVINHYTGDDDIVLPMHVSGRGLPVPDIMEMAFPTIANVPVRVQLPTGLPELLASSAGEPKATTSQDPEERERVEEFLQKLQQDQIQLGTTIVSHAGLSAIGTYSDSCRKAVDVCRHHPQGSLDIQYATATFRPDVNKQDKSNSSAAKIDVEMQVNVQDAKYFSPDDALSLGCYKLDGSVVRLVFVYDSKVVRKEQVAEYAIKLETSIRALVSVLGAGYECM